MSIYGAMFSGVSGLSAQSQALGIIADNISNVNTVGYKTSKAAFSTLVTQTRSSNQYAPGGVQSKPVSMIDKQGLLQASSSATDIAISGNGFLVVSTEPARTDTSTYAYTRTGAFTADSAGYLKTPAGYYLQGWAFDVNGEIPASRSDLNALESVNISALTGSSQPTTEVGIKANMKASETAAAYVAGDMSAYNATGGTGGEKPHFETSVDIVDSRGGARTLTLGFFRDSALPANQWRAEVYAEDATEVTNANGLLSSGIVAFNTDGSLDLTNTTLSTSLSISTWAASLGVASSNLTLNLGTDGATNGLTQFDSSSLLISSDVNGAVFGALSGVDVDSEGVVTALFDNGIRQPIYKLPVALFPNPNGLNALTGNVWIASTNSGNFTLQESGVGAAGQISPATLEASTVDLAEEFATMITTQRAYSASSKIITTADQMLDELIRVVR